MEALDQLSQATMENIGTLAQLNAGVGGAVNLNRASADTAAILLPGAPQIPWVRGKFDDFERPVKNGLLPDGVDDKATNRGPYDIVFGWRSPVGGQVVGMYHDSFEVAGGGGHGAVPLGGGPGHDSAYAITSRTADAYRVFGPHSWDLMRIGGWSA